MNRKIIYTLLCVLTITSCKIDNDIPYPIVEGNILSMEVEGQSSETGDETSSAVINKTDRTVKLYVDDTVDLTKIKIKKLTVGNDASIAFDKKVCISPDNFPSIGFESVSALNSSADTRVDFTNPVAVLLHTYQDYNWTITVTQVINRSVFVDNQIGKAVIDPVNKTVVINVNKDQPLNAIKVTDFNLVGDHGTVSPDPMEYDTYDFTEPREFEATYGWEETSSKWKVYVYHSEAKGASISSISPMTIRAIITGDVQKGKTPVVEYKKTAEKSWRALANSAIVISGTTYNATLSALSAATSYQVRVTEGDNVSEIETFKTTAKASLPNGTFDDWNQTGDAKRLLWSPWALGGTSFWDTGNKGATTVSSSNTVPTDETCNGKGQAAFLESKYVVIKFAAGNIFTGEYVRTDGTNGILSFGRPFTAFPSKLRINYKYTSSTIDKTSTEMAALKGRPDSCHIYIALTDWDEPREIRTASSNRQLFDKTDSHIIAYAELIQGTTNSAYKQLDMILNYRYTNRTPKYIVIVATSSKYGDYFTGGTGSKLWLDNFELIYD